MTAPFPLLGFVTITFFNETFKKNFARRDVDVAYTWRRFLVVKIRISKT